MSLKNVVLGIAIIILTISVAVYGVNIIYDSPEYNDFCSEARGLPLKESGDDRACPAVCIQMYELKEVQCVTAPCNPVCEINECGSGCGPDGINSFDTLGQCEIVAGGEKCYDLYEDARETYSKNIFLIALPLGIAIMVAGALIFGLEAVGAGLMGGGVGIVLWGVGGFWRFADDWLKFILSLAGLVVVVWLTYYWNNKLEKKGKKKRK